MAVSNPITLAEAKEYLRVDGNDEDAFIETCIAAAVETVFSAAWIDVGGSDYEMSQMERMVVLLYIDVNYRRASDEKQLQFAERMRGYIQQRNFDDGESQTG